jgi:large subunit ribosomal protein L21
MYAVIETGGKQYRVEVGTELEIDLLEAGPGEAVAFDRVLLVADGEHASIGRPVVTNASVSGEVVRRDRGEKLISFKYRPKARRRVKKGHRQDLTIVRISDIVLDGRSAAGEVAKAEEQKRTERQKLEDAARKQAEQDAALAAKLAAAKPAAEKPAAEKPAAPKASAKASDAASPRSTRTRKAASTGDTTDKAADAPSAAPKTRSSGTSRARKTDKD